MSVTQVQTPGIADDAITTDKTNFETALVPIGGIIMWSGASVPTGWSLCDGQNGTPDLRNRFIVGSGNSYNIGDTGGSNTVTLNETQIPAHNHGVLHDAEKKFGTRSARGPWISPPEGIDVAIGFLPASVTTQNTGGGKEHENRPPYYALAFIMRVS